jgi:hypothetical protein
MKATDFEFRHQILLHQFVVLVAFLIYLVDRDDIVWRFIKNGSSDVRSIERAIFAVATILFGIAAYICTQSRIHHRPRYLGEFLYAIALGSLAPLAGFVVLVAGETIRLLRLALRPNLSSSDESVKQEPILWLEALRSEAVKWGLFLTMIVFTITLKDRVAEVLAGLSVLVWIILNIWASQREAG